MSLHSGDLCASQFCDDLAHPGHDHCTHCIADRQAERQLVATEATRITHEHQAHIEQQEERT